MGIQINPEEFNRAVQSGEDIPHFRPTGTLPITVELPAWLIDDLDIAANRLKVSRDDLIRVWLGDRLLKRP